MIPKITVLLPHFHHQAYLADAVQSIIDQTFQDWELLILNTEKHEKHFQTMRDCAKHEALHLLIARLEDLAKRRYVTPGDINEECEGIVEILEKSIL